jgi:hypothetical protein
MLPETKITLTFPASEVLDSMTLQQIRDYLVSGSEHSPYDAASIVDEFAFGGLVCVRLARDGEKAIEFVVDGVS